MKRGDRGVSTPFGDKEFLEKLGRNDPCPCGSGKRFQTLLPRPRPVSTGATATTTDAIDGPRPAVPDRDGG
ncbi:MAG TPA: SEC-C metal-binding domain-containing protein, partial [Phycisphaerales bacterium]|nr:SEC-C metal-binding domain-containing protein [Phycisphaerales bacterium]